MKSSVFLSSHNDDETLFAAYTLMTHRPHVVVCFRSTVQAQRGGPEAWEREKETLRATDVLGCRYTQLDVPDDGERDTASLLEDALYRLRLHIGPLRTDHHEGDPGVLWVPLWEEGGHGGHNMVSDVARIVYGHLPMRFYATYRRGSKRTETDREVVPSHPDMYALKLKAMSCYASQIALPECRPWFNDWEREWIA